MLNLSRRILRTASIAGFCIVMLFAMSALGAPPAPDQDIEHQIDAMLAKLSLEQKIDLIGGVSTWYTTAEPSIGIMRRPLLLLKHCLDNMFLTQEAFAFSTFKNYAG